VQDDNAEVLLIGCPDLAGSIQQQFNLQVSVVYSIKAAIDAIDKTRFKFVLADLDDPALQLDLVKDKLSNIRDIDLGTTNPELFYCATISSMRVERKTKEVYGKNLIEKPITPEKLDNAFKQFTEES